MAICPICQEPNRDRNIFCVNCGTELIPSEFPEPSVDIRPPAPQAEPVQEREVAPFPDLPTQPEPEENLSASFPEELSDSLKITPPPLPVDPPAPKVKEDLPTQPEPEESVSAPFPEELSDSLKITPPPLPVDPPAPKVEVEPPPHLDSIVFDSKDNSIVFDSKDNSIVFDSKDKILSPDDVLPNSPSDASAGFTSPVPVGWQNECSMCGFENEPDADYCCQCGTAMTGPENEGADFENRAKLLQIAMDGSQTGEYDIDVDGLAIDSQAGELVPAELYRVQHHALFRINGDEIILTPPSGENRILTRIPSKKPRKIQTGSIVSLGGQVLLFEASAQKPDVWGLLTSQQNPETKKVIELDQEDITIGREAGQVRFADDPLMSRSHMRIYIANGRYFVMDLESTNGTFVGVDTEYQALPGEVFLIGGIIFKIAQV